MSDMHDKLYDLLDGMLPPDQEMELFSALTGDQGLRDELKDQLSIRTAVNSDKRAFVPSPDSTAGIMTRLGFTGSGAGAAVALQRPGYLKYLQSAVLTATGIIVGFLISSDIFWGGTEEQNLEDSAVQTVGAQELSMTSEIPAVAAVSSQTLQTDIQSEQSQQIDKLLKEIISLRESLASERLSLSKLRSENSRLLSESTASEQTIAELEAAYADKNQELNQYIEKLRESTNLSNEQASDIAALNNMLEEREKENISIVNTKENKVFDNVIPNEITLINQFENSRSPNEQLGMSLYVMGTVYGHGDAPMVSPVEYPTFNNMGLGIAYEVARFGENWSVEGLIEVRRENFSMSYDLRPGDPESPRANQQPNFNTMAGGARLNYIVSDEYALSLFGDAVAGTAFSADVLTAGGAVLRPRAGAEWYMTGGSYLMMSYDYGILLFDHEGTAYTSTKDGFTIGMGVDF